MNGLQYFEGTRIAVATVDQAGVWPCSPFSACLPLSVQPVSLGELGTLDVRPEFRVHVSRLEGSCSTLAGCTRAGSGDSGAKTITVKRDKPCLNPPALQSERDEQVNRTW